MPFWHKKAGIVFWDLTLLSTDLDKNYTPWTSHKLNLYMYVEGTNKEHKYLNVCTYWVLFWFIPGEK